MTIEDHVTFNGEEPELADIVGDLILQTSVTEAGLVLPFFVDDEGKVCQPESFEEPIVLENGFQIIGNHNEQPKLVGPKVHEAYFGMIERVLLDALEYRRVMLRFAVGYGLTEDAQITRLKFNYGIETTFFSSKRTSLERDGFNRDSIIELKRKFKKGEIKAEARIEGYDFYGEGGESRVITHPQAFIFGGKGRAQTSSAGRVVFEGLLDYDVTLRRLCEIVNLPISDDGRSLIAEETLRIIGNRNYLVRL